METTVEPGVEVRLLKIQKKQDVLEDCNELFAEVSCRESKDILKRWVKKGHKM